MLRTVALASSIAPIALLASAALVACNPNKPKVQLPKDNVVVAKVNGSPITRYDVEHLGTRGLGDLVAAVGSESYPRLRQAAIESRAIAQAAEKDLTAIEKLALEKELAAYREQLLVRRYLSKHSPPQPVTPAMVREYYKLNPERFGAKSERSYELIGTTRALTPPERDKIIDQLKPAETEADWATLVQELGKKGLPLALTKTTPSDPQLHERLRELFQQLEPGKPSRVTFILGRAYVARAKGEVTKPARPFEEVRADIERMLQPSQLSAAVEKASKQVMAEARVEIVEPSNPAPRGSAP